MPEAARVGDASNHGPPLNPGIGSPDVIIGYMPAWRALPASVASAVDGVSNTMKSFMQKPVLTPANAASDIAQISQKLTEAGAKAAAAGAPSAAGTASSQLATVNTTNAALTTAWTSASAAPGGQPAANTAYTEGIKVAAGAAASAVMAAIGGLADMHICPIPSGPVPHGPGMVTKGSGTVLINNLPACRKGDKLMEACGGADPIGAGCASVLIDDQTGSGGGGGAGGGGGGGGGGSGGGAGSGDDAPAPAEQTYADSDPESQPPGSSTQNAGAGTHWLEIEMVDEAEQPCVGERYVVQSPDSREIRGGLDSQGKVRITGIKDPGMCSIKFPNLDLAAWERWRPAPPQPPLAPNAAQSSPSPTAGSGATQGSPGQGLTQTAPVPPGPAAPAGEWRKVRLGECISSLARDAGLFWETIWNHASNAELKRRRGDPNVLLPGDAVFVPERRPKEDSGNTDQKHKFRRKGEPSQVIVYVLVNDEPLADRDYQLVIDGRTTTGKTGADGSVTMFIPGNARRGWLKVHDDDYTYDYPLSLGELDPLTSIKGVQQRLNNLGYDCGPADGQLNEQTKSAIKRFQAANNLALTGTPDQAMQAKLEEQHKS